MGLSLYYHGLNCHDDCDDVVKIGDLVRYKRGLPEAWLLGDLLGMVWEVCPERVILVQWFNHPTVPGEIREEHEKHIEVVTNV